jgi:hypothetical protein
MESQSNASSSATTGKELIVSDMGLCAVKGNRLQVLDSSAKKRKEIQATSEGSTHWCFSDVIND